MCVGKDLKYFKAKNTNDKDICIDINEYLFYILENSIDVDYKIKSELFNFLNEYHKKTMGISIINSELMINLNKN